MCVHISGAKFVAISNKGHIYDLILLTAGGGGSWKCQNRTGIRHDAYFWSLNFRKFDQCILASKMLLPICLLGALSKNLVALFFFRITGAFKFGRIGMHRQILPSGKKIMQWGGQFDILAAIWPLPQGESDHSSSTHMPNNIIRPLDLFSKQPQTPKRNSLYQNQREKRVKFAQKK